MMSIPDTPYIHKIVLHIFQKEVLCLVNSTIPGRNLNVLVNIFYREINKKTQRSVMINGLLNLHFVFYIGYRTKAVTNK